MAETNPFEKITKLMEERVGGYASAKTQGKELSEMTGLDPDIAEAFFKGLTSRGANRKSDVRGYIKTRHHKKSPAK